MDDDCSIELARARRTVELTAQLLADISGLDRLEIEYGSVRAICCTTRQLNSRGWKGSIHPHATAIYCFRRRNTTVPRLRRAGLRLRIRSLRLCSALKQQCPVAIKAKRTSKSASSSPSRECDRRRQIKYRR